MQRLYVWILDGNAFMDVLERLWIPNQNTFGNNFKASRRLPMDTANFDFAVAFAPC